MPLYYGNDPNDRRIEEVLDGRLLRLLAWYFTNTDVNIYLPEDMERLPRYDFNPKNSKNLLYANFGIYGKVKPIAYITSRSEDTSRSEEEISGVIFISPGGLDEMQIRGNLRVESMWNLPIESAQIVSCGKTDDGRSIRHVIGQVYVPGSPSIHSDSITLTTREERRVQVAKIRGPNLREEYERFLQEHCLEFTEKENYIQTTYLYPDMIPKIRFIVREHIRGDNSLNLTGRVSGEVEPLLNEEKKLWASS